MRPGSAIVSPEDQSATFIELFFDLVFVFSVTQVVGLLHDGFTWAAAGRATLIFWLVWWAWTQFTWALNAANTTHPWVEVGTLLATGVAFFMAIALPDAFAERALWFAVSYVLVRVVGLSLYSWVSWQNDARRAAVRGFALLSVGGFAAVLLGAFFGGAWQYGFWGLAILLDIFAAREGNYVEGWNIHPEHFVERHGLFAIIALGETLIVAGNGVAGEAWTTSVLAVAVLAVAITCAFWWSYFPNAKPALEQALASRAGGEQAELAREAFSLLHFPIFLGVIAFAYAVEEAVLHPDEPFSLAARVALALGLALFVGGVALAVRRATGRVLWPRLILVTLSVVVLLLLSGVLPAASLTVALLGTASIAALEQRRGSPLSRRGRRGQPAERT